MKKIILNSIGVCVYLIVYVLRFFNIYFFRYPNAFGHQTMNVEYFARKVKFISKAENPILVGIRHYEKKRTIANNSLLEHHKHSGLKIVNNKLVCFLLNIGLTFQKQQIEKIYGEKYSAFLTMTIADLSVDQDVHLLSDIALPFDKNNKLFFKNILNKMSLKNGEYYIVLDRGGEYYKGKSRTSLYKWQYSPIELQYKAAIAMKKHGIKSVSMGHKSKNNIESDLVLDYPSKFRESMGDIADLALMDGCKFYVGQTSGVFGLAQSLKKPVLLCNVFPWPWSTVPMGNTSIVMPKKLWLIKEKRIMTLLEMIELESKYKLKEFIDREVFTSLSIELILNTEDEILDAVKEINSRIDGTWNGKNYKLSSILKGCIGKDSQSYLSTAFVNHNMDILKGINL
jgi:putative glycosyltransferase (TIGR04372 family)